jgi:hypothetical protein
MGKMIDLKNRTAEKGNVLFLILIAVALFAALSYAVTQSSRSGGGDANNETNLINSAQVTQYPASVRTAIIRMMVSNSIETGDLEFNPPSDFATCTGTPPTACVFHPQGGGATYVIPSADVLAVGATREWIFNGENEVNLVGTTGGSDAVTTSTAEVMAILPNVSKSICERINKELGIGGGVPTESNIDVSTNMGTGSTGTWVTDLADGPGGTIGEGAASSLDGQAFGCFQQPASTYNYYHVLIEQ